MKLSWILAAATALLVLIRVLLRIISSQFQPIEPNGLSNGFRRRSLAIEFVGKHEDVVEILGLHNGRNRNVMRQLQVIDFLFIFSYWFLFTATAFGLRKRQQIIADLVIFCISAAAWFDVKGNLAILSMLRRPLDASIQRYVDRCRISAFFKWVLLLLAMILLSPLFLDYWRAHSGSRSWMFLTSAIMLAAAGLTGLVTLPFGRRFESIGGRALTVTIAVILITFLWR